MTRPPAPTFSADTTDRTKRVSGCLRWISPPRRGLQLSTDLGASSVRERIQPGRLQLITFHPAPDGTVNAGMRIKFEEDFYEELLRVHNSRGFMRGIEVEFCR